MSKRMFTREQIQALLPNKNVTRCSQKSITYDSKFKVRAVKQYYDQGMSSAQIFKEAGFDLVVIGEETPNESVRRWRKAHRRKGPAGLLKDGRGKHGNGGRPKTKGFTDKERIEYLEAKVAYLKAENYFLAKLRAARKE